MYLDYFGFDEPPFSITPDPKFVYLSEKHQESLAHLVYGITRGGGAGFVQLTGEVGTGKTTISRLLLEQIPDKTNIALILNPTIKPVELLETICKELKIPLRGLMGKLNNLIDKLNDYLLQSWSSGENTVVIIDEAQNLPRDTLEQLRLLTNLETDKQKLLQIVLIGQPELRSTMRRNDLRQLAQRVTARYHLLPLSSVETFEYLQHRIKVAGGSSNIIKKSTSKKIYQLTEGIPRLINTLTDRALLAAYAQEKTEVNSKHIQSAAREVLVEAGKKKFIFSLKNTARNIILTILAGYIAYFLTTNYFPDWQFKKKPDSVSILIPKANQVDYNTFVPASSAHSWRYYLTLWGAKTDKPFSSSRCPNSSLTGMACLRRQGNLQQISKINHPVLLQFEDSSLALLSAIKGDKIGVLNNHTDIEYIDKTWLEQHWLGTYFIIWPMPAELLINPQKQPLQVWGLEMANTISINTIENKDLNEWIIHFQQENGLLSDGIVGSETQMALSLNAYNGPTLK